MHRDFPRIVLRECDRYYITDSGKKFYQQTLSADLRANKINIGHERSIWLTEDYAEWHSRNEEKEREKERKDVWWRFGEKN